LTNLNKYVKIELGLGKFNIFAWGQ
jgi:hypothetical protein